ncbi:secretion protein HlyD [Bordetella sp. H567]|uniref:MdtA/MuxA family multidrug efflux RND transporter periplasmic adaptor subunit n=1 Tax=Bordetella sp. H567 TaxID=1697043 RepID=UPI00081CF51D|nr:MdtA/MuxA family multidrug efflux RND transporter periplasmic adaptor subunit [Bordetella sp. H567]AOB33938.1 secretion protein HlyD [Bordetella sp. H567]
MSDRTSLSPSSRSRRRTVAWIVAILVVAGIAWLVFRPKPAAEPGGQARAGAAGQRSGAAAGGRHRPGAGPGAGPVAEPPVPVRVYVAATKDVDISLPALGTVTAYNTVTVRSRVDGELVQVNFKEGQRVKAGDVLAQVDPRPFNVQLQQALGTQQQNLAQLENARRDLARYQALFKQDSIARQQVDTQAALVRQYEGTLKTDQANVDNARLQLTFARITAPIDGRLGLRQVDPGNLVSSGDTTGLVVITQTQPIAVIFTLPETQLPDVREQLAHGRTLRVDAWDRANTKRLATGVLETLDNQIDVSTGTVKAKARFDNTDDALFPNQFVNIQLLVETRKGMTVIPNGAVQRGSQGPFVFVAQPDNTVAVRQLKLGPVSGDLVVVSDGLKPGDRVVTEGTDRLRAGGKVEVVTDAADVTPPTTGASLGAGPATATPGTSARTEP